MSGLCSRTVSPGTVVTAIGTCWGLPSRPWRKPCSRKLLFPLHSPRAPIHTSLTTGPWGVPVLLSRLHPSSLGGSWWAGMGALGPQHCPAGPGTTESREWVNGGLRQILPGTQPGVSGAQSSQPCQGELRGRGWDLRPPPRQALAANRGEQSGGASGTGHLASQTAPGERLPGSRALSPPLPSLPPGTAGAGAAHQLQLGRGFWELFPQRGGRWREPARPVRKPRALWPGASRAPHPTASVYPSGPI